MQIIQWFAILFIFFTPSLYINIVAIKKKKSRSIFGYSGWWHLFAVDFFKVSWDNSEAFVKAMMETSRLVGIVSEPGNGGSRVSAENRKSFRSCKLNAISPIGAPQLPSVKRVPASLPSGGCAGTRACESENRGGTAGVLSRPCPGMRLFLLNAVSFRWKTAI